MFLRILVISTLLANVVRGQSCYLSGHVGDASGKLLSGAVVMIFNDADTFSNVSSMSGAFLCKGLSCGTYSIQVYYTGFAVYNDTITTNGKSIFVRLHRTTHHLKEVRVAAKAPMAVQHGDTVVYRSSAYKVSPDADAAALVRKMPSIDISGRQVTAGGEPVVRVLVDGIPFYGNDAWTSLRNLPADMVALVQVYTDHSDLEKLSGYHEGPGTKTINIITPASRRVGVFGNVYAGAGGDATDWRYGTGASLNRFNGQQRMSANAQVNNVNRQGYADVTATSGASGITHTAGGGMTWADRWGKSDISGSYMYSNSYATLYNDIDRIYISPSVAGQEYEEHSPVSNGSRGHQASVRITMAPDSLSTLILAPSLLLQGTDNTTQRSGVTRMGGEILNETNNTNSVRNDITSLTGSGTWSRKMGPGRALSANVVAGFAGSKGATQLTARNVYYSAPAAERITDQLIETRQQTWNLTSALVYTARQGSHGQVKLEYNNGWQPSQATRYTYSYAAASGGYTQPDSGAWNEFSGSTVSHKAGMGYRYNAGKLQLSAGVYGKYAVLQNRQTLPQETDARFSFLNMLPTAGLQYRPENSINIQVDYSTDTRLPSVSQMQRVMNNTDPLHVTIGNAALQQTYVHALRLRYNATRHGGRHTMSMTAGTNITDNYITQATTIAQADTVVSGVQLQRGGQLTTPVNAKGYRYYNVSLSYGMPADMIKCKLTLYANADMSRIPLVVNSVAGFMQVQHANMNAKLVSNISDRIDFSLMTGAMLTGSTTTMNMAMPAVSVAYDVRPSLNLIMKKGFVLNTEAAVRFNTGMQTGYNQNFTVWNVALGKKVFRKQQGDIRLSVYDVLNRNTGVYRNVGDTYIQDTRTNMLQRYALLTFAYRISSFRGQ